MKDTSEQQHDKYCELRDKLNALFDKDSKEADELREQMDVYWYSMSEDDRNKIRSYP